MSKQSINHYYNKLHQYKTSGHTRNESSIRRAFANLLEEYCESKKLTLVDELVLKNSTKRPDATVRSTHGLDYGHWESKDTKDSLDEEIEYKFSIGYPKFNIIFENTVEIVLIQKGEETMRGEMEDADFLHRILTEFLSYERPELTEFHKAVERFKEDIPDIVKALRAMIEEQSAKNPEFDVQREKFWNVCRESINPEISAFDIREMLIQHILTAEIFDTVFGDSHFHRENNIARELEIVINTFFTGTVRRNTLAQIDSYYKAIKAEAARIDNHHDKQRFLKIVYENFYKAYNPKGADRLGVVYTPNEIVHFMVDSTDYLLEKHFGKNLADKNVEILDPATGTGTFITEIIEHIPPQYLKHKYLNELHCNELAILPYYIANLNIEYTYQQKMDEYQPFNNIVFVDTLDNLGFGYAGKQMTMFAMSAENLDRIRNQNSKKISVIIGNPPYNANQMNENDNNKNREYPKIDKRIKDTYIHHSTAQKTKVYDMYARFLRWSSDRLDKNGIIAFITNRSYIDSRTFDGFRKIVSSEFNRIYIVDLGGDVRQNPKLSGTKHNVFGIQTGVAIVFLVRVDNIFEANSEEEFEKIIDDNLLREPMVKYGAKTHYSKRGARIFYYRRPEMETAKEKLEFLTFNKLKNIPFESIHPDYDNNWINLSTADDWETMLPLNEKGNKKTIFHFSSLGVSTNRDEWVYDFSKKNLQNKIQFFIKRYNFYLQNKITSWETDIKWSEYLKGLFSRGKNIKFKKAKIISGNYRPFIKQFFYAENLLNDRLTQNHYDIFGEDLDKTNIGICINKSEADSKLLAINQIYDLHFTGDSLCLPLYLFDKKGNRIENITDWGLEQFKNNYELIITNYDKISKEDFFHYTYAVLHNPAYRRKYELNLKREFPRLPFYKDFWKWAAWGKQLMDMHINYETVEHYELKITNYELNKKEDYVPKSKLKAIPENGEIILDENTTLTGVPSLAWDYKLGNRSALHWILDQYKEKTPKDPTIKEKFNTYKFADYKDKVIDLIKRVTTVSVRTMEIVNQMESEEGHNF